RIRGEDLVTDLDLRDRLLRAIGHQHFGISAERTTSRKAIQYTSWGNTTPQRPVVKQTGVGPDVTWADVVGGLDGGAGFGVDGRDAVLSFSDPGAGRERDG
ncbi:MAG: hypothetical protein GY745_24075, partial [Actinomycetia bacterium]|nr:hypothetical protein [Actinomycetes bacterium]